MGVSTGVLWVRFFLVWTEEPCVALLQSVLNGIGFYDVEFPVYRELYKR